MNVEVLYLSTWETVVYVNILNEYIIIEVKKKIGIIKT